MHLMTMAARECITKGKYADMVILDKNIFDIPVEEIKIPIC